MCILIPIEYPLKSTDLKELKLFSFRMIPRNPHRISKSSDAGRFFPAGTGRSCRQATPG